MKIKLTSLIVLVLIVSGVQSGCTSSPTKYVAPSGAVARVNSAIRSAFRGEEQITISILKEERGCGFLDWRPLEGQRTLFVINRSQSFPEGSISIEANKPVRLRYFQEGLGSGPCEVMVEVTLDAGKEYTFFGGHLAPENPNTARRCMFGIKDQSSNLSVKAEQLTRESLCAKTPKSDS